MKKLILSLLLFSTAALCAQETKETPKTALVTSNVTKDYQPDYYKVIVSIKEYENINPDDQKATRININEAEQAVNKKLDELNIKSNAVEVINVGETYAMQNAYNFNANYTATQKRELCKTISFQVKTNKELEKVFIALRINGVSYVSAQLMFTAETQIKIENELLQMGMEKARNKANKLEALMGKKLGEVISVWEENNAYMAQGPIDYNSYYANIAYTNNGSCTKTLSLRVSYKME